MYLVRPDYCSFLPWSVIVGVIMKTKIDFLCLFVAQSFIIVNCGGITPRHSSSSEEALFQTPSGSISSGNNGQEQEEGIHVIQPDSFSATHEMTDDDDATEVIEGSTPPPPPIPESSLTHPPPIPPWFDGISLLGAVKMGNLEAVKYRISVAGDNPTAERDGPGPSTPIHAAAINGELAILKYLVEEAGVPVDSTDEDGWTPLHLGAQGCHLHVIKYLVEKGAELGRPRRRTHDSEDDEDSSTTPLRTAVESNCFKAMSYLLEQGADVNETDSDGDTLLHLAARRKGIQTAAALLNGGAPLEARNRKGLTPLHLLISRVHDYRGDGTNMVKYLIARGADVKTVDARGNTMLDAAAKSGGQFGLFLVKYLVDSGVEPNAQTVVEFLRKPSPAGQVVLGRWRNCSEAVSTSTPQAHQPPNLQAVVPLEYKYMSLDEAIRSGDVDAVRFRLSVAGDNDSAVSYSYSHMVAAIQSGNLEMVKYLVEEAGVVDVNGYRDYPYETPLLHTSVQLLLITPSGNQLVTKAKAMEVVRYLVGRGANLSATDSYGSSALHIAARGAYLEPVQYLIEEAGADVNAKDKRGSTPLHEAVERLSLHIVYFLVEHGAAVNAGDKRGLTPLASLVNRDSGNRLALIKYLVRNGAHMNPQFEDGNNGKTTLAGFCASS